MRAGAAGPTAVLLVRNGVTHDARVQRAAAVLRDEGYTTAIIGSVTASQPAARERTAGNDIVRLRARSPVGALRRVTGGRLPGSLAALHRTMTALDWNRRAIGHLVRLRPQLIHANDYNTMWPALAIQVLTGARVVYDSHELWADRNGRPEWRRWLVATERRFVRRADAVITASPGYAGVLAERYEIPRPPVIRNVPERRSTAGRSPAIDYRECVYVGGLMPGRGLEQAIAALALAPDCRLRLIGSGGPQYVERLRQSAADLGVVDRVIFAGPVAAGEVVDAAERSGFGLCLIQPICRSYELTLPNKLFEYAVAGVPVLASRLPVIAETVAAGGLGVTVDPTDVEAVAAAMQNLSRTETNDAFRSASRAFARANAWDGEREVLAGIYRAVAGSGIR